MNIEKLEKPASMVNRIVGGIVLAESLFMVVTVLLGLAGKNEGALNALVTFMSTYGIWVTIFVLGVPLMIIFTSKYIRYAKAFDRSLYNKPYFPKQITKTGIFALFGAMIFLLTGFVINNILSANDVQLHVGLPYLGVILFVVFAYVLIFVICLNEIKDAHKGEKKKTEEFDGEDENVS